jgi:hypothetical protein
MEGGAEDAASPVATIPGWGLERWGPPGWTSADWGARGVWLEPFDLPSVHTTLHALFTHYTHQAAESDASLASAPLVSLSGSRAGGARAPCFTHAWHACMCTVRRAQGCRRPGAAAQGERRA